MKALQIIKVDNYDELSFESYRVIEKLLIEKPTAIINTTTGGTYDGMFEYLVKGINGYKVPIKQSIWTNLDEYISEREAQYSVYTYMHKKFYNLITSHPKEIHLIDGSIPKNRISYEISRYAHVLKNRPRDLQILGLGTNGHLGANEPGTPFDSKIFLANSHESTILSTIKYHNLEPEKAPSQMITMGFQEIMSAKMILVAASGKHKAKAVRNMIEGPINESNPASILRLHPNVVCILDKEASSLLSV